MEKITTTAYGRVLSSIQQEKKKEFNLYYLKKHCKEAVICLLAFSCGQISMFHVFNPIGIAFLAAYFLEGYEFYLITSMVGLGFIVGGKDVAITKYILCIALSIIFNFVVSGKMKKLTDFQKSILGSIIMVLSGGFYAIVSGGSKYLTFVALMEGLMVFCITFVLIRGLSVLKSSIRRKILTNEEIISLSLLVAGGVAGVAGITVWGISLKTLLATFIILTAGFRGGTGIGAATGVLIGFTLMISGEASVTLFCIFSIAGLLCGALSSMGRGVTLLSYMAGIAIITFYMDSTFLTREVLIGTAIGGGIFLILPKKCFAFLNTYACYEKEFDEDTYFIKTKEVMRERLKGFSRSFQTLSKTFSNRLERKSTLSQKEVARLIDDVSVKVCNNCGLYDYCWKNNFYNTYQTIFSVLSACEKRGNITINDIPDDFRKGCVRLEHFLDTINRTFEIYKANIVWENKLEESRELVSQQLSAVAEIINDISDEIDLKLVFNESLGKEIKARLDKVNVTVTDVNVIENKNNSYEVILKHSPCYGKRACLADIIPVVNSVLGKRMKRENGKCKIVSEDTCVLKLIEENRLRLTTGVASITKEGSEISGDSYSFVELKDGSCMMALSDGMGSGRAANKESTTTIELLEQFIDCGFEKDMALKMINSVLVLKSNDETFSTLDICSVNLYTGMAEFIKIGGASAFILRDGAVKVIRSYSLPVGILKNMDVEKNDLLLKPDDIIVLVTDGVGDIIEKEKKGEEWMQEIFKEFRSNNPQDIAEYILIQAKKKINYQIRDDMTVFAARLWEK